ncbi:hypothetical protein PBY51_018114 [Eleginops maclovinus]|uniref:Uncharacterized protein n=1 Tax=Eleginops maclovinus TaxID=56733 RepID=A0AAN8APV0_ELEMC|nr:hypothetical protein PBY51_018114 [Eleginops maclovinus]
MRPDPINWGFVNSCVFTVTAAVLLCEPWRGDEGCEGLEEDRISVQSVPCCYQPQSSPELTWRDVQHLIANTAQIPDPKEPGWNINAAGYHVHHRGWRKWSFSL